MEISGMRVLVTGGGSGIGLAIAKAMVSQGAEVLITGRDEEKLKAASQGQPLIHYKKCDVTKEEDIKSLVKSVERMGGIQLLINNAGVLHKIDYANGGISLDEQLEEIDVGFNGPVRMVHHFLPMLREQNHAAIVNVSSEMAYVPLAIVPVFSAAKAALRSWTRSLRWQLDRSNVKVFELMPPMVDTSMVSEFNELPKMKPESLADILIGALKSDKYEINVGHSKHMSRMNRLAPEHTFKKWNESFR